MDKFVVPQFLDTEGKIFGPVTVRQFLIMIVTGGLIFAFYKTFTFYTFIGASLLVAALGIIIAFVKVNGRPIQYFLLNVFQNFHRPRVRVWAQRELHETYKVHKGKNISKVVDLPRKTFQHSRLSSLALMVDTGGRYQGEETKDLKVQSMDMSID